MIDKTIKAKVKRIGGKDSYETAAIGAKELPASSKAVSLPAVTCTMYWLLPRSS